MDEKVISDISLSVNASETVVLTWSEWCGKTTLLKLINRLIEPDTGDILLDGSNIFDRPKESLRREIGYVIQDSGLLPHLSVQQNIELVGKISGKIYLKAV